MKNLISNSLRRSVSAPLLFAATLASVPAASLTPGATGDAPVAAAIAGRPNLALASGGATAFSSSDLTPAYAAPRVNDGVIDHTGNSWIPVTTASTEYVGVALSAASTVAAVVFHGQTGYNGRSAGTWSLQYTTDAVPGPGSAWIEIGTYVYAEPDCAAPMPRTLFSFTVVANVTAVRLVLVNSACGLNLAVQEFEAYGPVSIPPQITSHPAGGTVVAGSDFTFSVVATGAETFQWRKNGTAIPGAIGTTHTVSDVKTNDAGSYTVVVGNASGTVTSDPAVLEVTPAAPPELAVQRAVIITWPSFPPGYVLQSAPRVTGPYVDVTNTPMAEGPLFKLALPSDPQQQFFQLIKP